MEKIAEKKVSIRRRKAKGVNETLRMIDNLSIKKMGSEGFKGTNLPVTGLTEFEKQFIMPELVEVPYNHVEFPILVNNYFHELDEVVPAKRIGLTLDITTDKQTVTIHGKDVEVDMPRNKRDYVLWKRAIDPKYKQVVSDITDLDGAGDDVKFYIHDEDKAKKQEREIGEERDNAYIAYLELVKKKELWDNVLLVHGLNPDVILQIDKRDILRGLAEASKAVGTNEKVEAYKKFYNTVGDKDLKDKGFVTQLVNAKIIEIVGSNYIYNNGAASIPIGKTIDQVVAWIRLPENNKDVLVMEAKLDNV